eukprot:gene19799-20281_t
MMDRVPAATGGQRLPALVVENIFGHDLRRKPSSALARLGVVFQARTLDPDLTVLQNFTYHAGLQGYSAAEGRIRAERLLAREIVDVVRGLIRDEGLSVLWATHLFDEVRPEDRLVLLHKGRVVTSGICADVIAASGAATLPEAFRRSTGAPAMVSGIAGGTVDEAVDVRQTDGRTDGRSERN